MSFMTDENTEMQKTLSTLNRPVTGLQYKIKPWEHQLEAIKRASSENEFALFFEVGTGKTLTAINILRHWYKQANEIKPTLVLCPPIVIDQWETEFKNNSNLSKYVVKLKGSGKKRLTMLQEGFAEGKKIFITNYETLAMKPIYALLMANIKYMVCDESHKLKSSTSQRTKLATAIADVTEKRLILTGSPILNSPMDIFSQFRILDKGKTFGRNFFEFRGKYFFDKNAGMPPFSYFPDWRPRQGIADIFNELIYQKAMKAEKEKCLDLPPFVRVKRPVELTPKQRKIYDELQDDFITYVDSGACVANMALVKLLRLQQVASGFIDLVKDGGDLENSEHFQEEIEHDRLDALKDLLEELTPNHKVIVWAPFRFNIKAIQKLCEKMRISHNTIYGGQSEKERTEGINNFRNNPDFRVCIANPKAGGVGLNLIEASYSIYYGRGYSLEDDLQSEARNYRGGSEVHTKVTRIDLYAPGTIDEEIMEALREKKSIAENILAFRNQLRFSGLRG